MGENKYGDPFMAISAAIIALTALGVIIYNKVPLKGLRPVTEVAEPSEQVQARLWQDPFTAVFDYVNSRPKGTASPEGDICPLFSNQSLEIQESVKKSALPQNIATFLRKEKEKVIILGIMVFGSRYAEETEFRIRQRVAVLAALGRLGYVPNDAEHLNFLRLYTSNKPAVKEIELSNILPYEWLENQAGPTDDRVRVLLLWLNDDSFKSQPLVKLNCLRSYLESADPTIKLPLKIIGPAGSSNLFTMVSELTNLPKNFQFPIGFEIYSPTATVSNALLLGLSEAQKSLAGILPTNTIEKQSKEKIQELFRSRGIKFARTIATDHQLAELLVNELENRQVHLLLREKNRAEGHDHRKEDNQDQPFYGGHKDHIALISEWDTFYGRSLPKIFSQIIRQKHNEGLNTEDPTFLPAASSVDWVHRYSYLRGLDGIVPASKEVQEPRPAVKGDSKGDAEKLRQEEPIGRSQYDYLRRLADRVYELDQQLRHEGSSLKAIGILGSDFYDKYLVLQAFKQRLPEVIFFTTDLDARLLHEVYNDWTRNFVIASGFDLKLPAKIQGEIPPFRSSYQTSVFLAVLKAFCPQQGIDVCTDLEGYNWHDPKLFEIGRQGAVDLQEISPGSPLVHELFFFVLLVLIFLWVIGSGFKTRNANPWHTVFLLIAVITFFLLYYLFQRHILFNANEEPFSLTQGVSVWPTEILRLVALFCSWFFFITSVQRLWENEKELAAEYNFHRQFQFSPGDRHPWYFFRRLWTSLARFYTPAGDAENRININELWEEYRRHSFLGLQVLRVIGIMLLYIPISRILIWYFGQPLTPVRGNLSIAIDSWLVKLTIWSFLFLNFFIFDTTRLLRCFIIETLDKTPVWNAATRSQFLENTGLPGEELDYWMLIRLVGQRSEVVSRLIYFPLIVWLILFISRWNYFDNWRTPLGLAFVISLSAIFTWSCALMLRHVAEKLRTQVIHRLYRDLVVLGAAAAPDAVRQTRVRIVLDEVKSMCQGAFTPFFQNPVVQALFVPFGGVGGLTLLDFLNKIT
jgi:hypothetical protein